MIGTSYVGGTQHAMAMEKAPELTTVIPVDAMSNCGYQSMRNAGAFELRFWNWIMFCSPQGSRQSRDPGTAAVLKEMMDNRHAYLANLPLRRGTTPLEARPGVRGLARRGDAARGERRVLGAEQHHRLSRALQGHSRLPGRRLVRFLGRQHDGQLHGPDAKTIKGPVYLIMGPWIHGQQGRSAHGQVSFGADAAIPDPLGLAARVVRPLAQGHRQQGRQERPPSPRTVRIFVMGTGDGSKTDDGKLNHGGYWRDEHEWPLARTQYTKFYLHPAGGLSTRHARRTMPRRPSFIFDPHNPVPTIGGNISSGNEIMLQGAWDQRGGEHIWNWHDADPAFGPKRRAGLPDRSRWTGRSGSDRRDRGQALGFVVRGRHRLHGQADRRLSAQPRLPRRVRPEHRRRHRPRPVPRVAQVREADGAGRRSTS